ncbi:MAG: helix-turn-helix transcriptional regulator [Rhodospirillales bacterium]|nr:helix-turn-helix transcriptional regulator [Rhodospirillales bacterium]MDE2200050.1 helix-turn-helix transcriptional regulator [Rhodospirillales bacterium]MDE2576758.1 helix-turn-helix transcriptional regulator [Rhodospirillales bacterium]
MRKPIDGLRVKALREQQKFTQKELAERAKISVDSLSRIENSRQSGKASRTVDGLAGALGVPFDVLTGDAPMPEATKPEGSGDRYQINVRVDGAIRNAFSLAAMRYKISASQIIELAPFLFVVAAEQSLRRRRAHVAEVQAALNKAEELSNASRSYLLSNLAYVVGSSPYLDAERVSIESRDLRAERLDEVLRSHLLERYDTVEESYDDARDNPFVVSLRESADGLGIGEIDRFWPGETEYCICRAEAVAFAGGDEEIAEFILDGSILIREVPVELLKKGAEGPRTAWLRAKAEEIRALRANSLTLDEVLDLIREGES